MTCQHDVTERETAATADGICPLCLQSDYNACCATIAEQAAEIERLRQEVGRLRAAIVETSRLLTLEQLRDISEQSARVLVDLGLLHVEQEASKEG